MKTNVKFIYTSFLLCLALLLTCFTATGTIRAYQHFQQDHRLTQAGDVTTVDAWMTIPYISHVYHVPVACFTHTLHLNDRGLVEYATLRVLADHYKQPLTTVILDVQHIILNYRSKQLSCGPPPKPSNVASTGAHTLPLSPRKGELQ